MKKLFIHLQFVLFFIASLFVSVNSYANHILGMDLYYTWVSGNTYKITMVIYGDCSPASSAMSSAFSLLPTATPRICIYRGNTNVGNLSLQIQAPINGVDITPVCGSEIGNTQCEDMSSAIPGIMKFVYSANYTLPAPVNGVWRFVHTGDLGNSQAGRSVNITNIVNPGPTVMQLIDTLNNTGGIHNSNAQFSVIPTPFFSLNTPDSYNPGAIDPDGDSLSVIDLIPAISGVATGGGMGGGPQCGFGNPVTYTGTAWPGTPISASTPLTVVAGSFSYDSHTGQLNFTPNITQRSTVVYNVREYRSGSFIGSCQREMNFLVQATSPPPSGGVTTVNGSGGIRVDSALVSFCGNSGPFNFTFNPHETGSTNNITVTWSGLASPMDSIHVVNNGTPTPLVTVYGSTGSAAPGTYIFYLTYTDNNCPLEATTTTAISVIVLPTSKVTYTVVSPIGCSPKEAINILPVGKWSPWTVKVTGDATQTFPGVTGGFIDSLSPGIDTISVAASTASRCDTPAIVVVPNPAITGDSIVCAGSTTRLSDAIAGGTWSSGDLLIATVVATGTAAGTVTGVSGGVVTISYALPSGCFETASITVKPLPSVIGGVLQVCNGMTTMLSDSLAGGKWTTSTSAIATIDSVSGVVTGLAVGTAIISYADNGCAISTSVTVNVLPVVGAGNPNICTDGTATLTATPGGGTWSLNNTSVATITPINTDSARITGIDNGITIVTYILPTTCVTTKTVTAVSVIPSIKGLLKVCTGQSIALSDFIVGGTWTSTNTSLATVDASAGVVTGVLPGVPTISYTIGGSCFTSTTLTVNQSPDHGAIIGLSNVCVGDMISLSDTISGGVWGVVNDSAGISAGGVVTGSLPGTDTVRYMVSNANCRDTATKPIRIYSVPVAGVIAGLNTLCVGTTTALSDTAHNGVWSSAATGIATVNTTGSIIVNGISAGVDTIKYTVSNPGCSTIARYPVTVYNPPVPGIVSGIAKVCAGAVYVLSDTTGGVWSSSNAAVATINSSTGDIHALSAGVTTIDYTIGPNTGRCYGIATYTVTVTPENTLLVSSNVTQIGCYGDNNGAISVSVSGGPAPYTYLWSNGNTTSSLTQLVPGLYTVHITEPATLCLAADSIEITQPDSLHVTAEMAQDRCKLGNGSIATTVTGGTQPYQYKWSDNSTGGTLDNLHAGTYTLTVTDMNGCSQTVVTEVTNNDCIINVHDVITPNGDGINDVWEIEGIDNYPSGTVQVFDKWGDIVYEKTNYNNDWGGKGKNGNLLPDGTYYYLVKLNSVNLLGNQNTWTGTIMIKR